MKTLCFILGIFGITAVNSFAQTNLPVPASLVITTNYKTMLVTNWLQPQERYVFIGKQLYDKYRSLGFMTVQIPGDAKVIVPYNGPVDATVHLLELRANWQAGQCHYYVIIKNFPFIRDQWNPVPFQVNQEFNQWSKYGCYAQALLVRNDPGYNQYGVITAISQEYDCGTPMTAPYKLVVSRQMTVLKTNQVETIGK